MARAHCIESLGFEVDFDSEDQALALQERLGAFARRRLPQIVAEVFDQASPVQECWRMERLELDLGAVDESWAEQQWETRLRSRLEELLQAERQALPRPPRQHTAAPANVVLQHPAAELQQLLLFLRRGHLSWAWHGSDPQQGPQALLLRALQQQPQALLAQWRASPEAASMLERASLQFGPAALGALALALAGGPGPAHAWVGEAEAWVEAALQLLEASASQLPALRALAWQSLLRALWREGTALDAARALRGLLQDLAPALGTRPQRLLLTLGRAAQQGSGQGPQARLLRQWQQALASDPAAAATDPEALLARLRDWLRPDPLAQRPEQPWLELLQADRAWARRSLLQLARSRRARRRMAEGLAAPRLAALLGLWLSAQQLLRLQALLDSPLLWSVPPGSEPLAPAQRWAWVLDQLLLQSRPELALPALLDALLLRQVTHGHAAPWLLALDGRAGQAGGLAEMLQPPLRAWLARHRLLPAAPPALAEAATPAKRRLGLLARLNQAQPPARPDPDWDLARREAQPWLRSVLLQLSRRPDWRRAVVRDWPTTPLQQLFALWLDAEDLATLALLATLAPRPALRKTVPPWPQLLHERMLLALQPGPARLDLASLWPTLAAALGQSSAALARDWLQALDDSTLREAAAAPRLRAWLQPLLGGASAEESAWQHLPGLLAQDTEPAALVTWRARLGTRLGATGALPDLPGLPAALAAPGAAQRLLVVLDETQRWELLARLRPLEQPALRRNTAWLMGLLRQALPTLSPARADSLPWPLICRELFEEGRSFAPAGYLRRLALHLRAVLPADLPWWPRLLRLAALDGAAEVLPPPAPPGPAPLDRWLARRLRMPQPRVLARLLQRLPAPMPAEPAPAAEAPPPAEPIYIENAGLVLAAAYLERLFGMLELCRGPAFADPPAARRAALLLQLVATGQARAEESALVLNKILCGLSLAEPLPLEIEPAAAERAAIEGMLAAMIAHWKAIGHTSVAGLRETFLQRQGRLLHEPERGWTLSVQPRPFDMLLDRLPWSFRLIKLPWMAEALHVQWR